MVTNRGGKGNLIKSIEPVKDTESNTNNGIAVHVQNHAQDDEGKSI